MKRLLIVSPHWLPFSAPDLQRVRLSLPHYRAHGWDPVVLGVDPAACEGPLEPELLRTVPGDIPVHRCPALPVSLTRPLGLGNLGWRCLPYLQAAGERLILHENIDLVLFSTTQFVTLLAGRAWRRRTGVPYVVDLQDPWRTDDYERPGAPPPPGGRKYQFARLVAWALEERTFRDAAGFISVSEDYLTTLRHRYAWMARRPSLCLPFGGSSADFSLARTLPADTDPAFTRGPGEVHLLYTGSAGPILSGSVQRLFHAVKEFRALHPGDAARLRLHFVGTQYASAGTARALVQPLADTFGIGDLVREVPHRIGYLASLRLQHACDGLLLLGSQDPAYSPSKLVPYVLSGRPVLTLAPNPSRLYQRRLELGGDGTVGYAPVDAVESTSASLHRFFAAALAGFPDPGRWMPSLTEVERRYGAATQTERQCRWFDPLCPVAHAAPRNAQT